MITVKPKLIFTCPENWDNMKIGLVSRYCENCKRDVQDFTNSSKEEILQFLWTNRNNKVCGRVFKSQLDYHHEEILVTINTYIKKNRNSNLSFYLFAIATMMLLGCSNNTNESNQASDTLTLILDGEGSGFSEKELSNQHPNCKIDSLLPDEFPPILGDLVVHDSLSSTDSNGVRVLAEIMPEYIGGFASLVAYIKENLKYPEWEKKAGIQGNVYVSFIIDKDGKIIDPNILKSVEGAKNFDKEVLRLINKMPKWKPGQEKGENVAVRFVIPIQFTL